MRIIQFLEGVGWSGGQQQTLFLCQHLNHRGHHCILACHPESELFARCRKLALPLAAISIHREFDFTAHRHLDKLMREFKPHLINTHRSRAHGLALWSGYRHSVPAICVSRRVLHPPNPWAAFKYRSTRIDGFIAVSPPISEVIQNLGVRPEKIRVIPSATDLSRFSPPSPDHRANARKAFGIPLPARVVALIGNLAPYKGQDFFLRVIAQLATIAGKSFANYRFLLAGRDTDSPAFLSTISAHPAAPQILPLGFREDVPELLAAADLSVNTSSSEGFAGTLRESLAMGIPAVVTAVGGNPAIITDGVDGWVIPFGDIVNFANAIHQLLSNEPQRLEFATRGLIKAKTRFSVASMIDLTIEFYQQLIERRRLLQ